MFPSPVLGNLSAIVGSFAFFKFIRPGIETSDLIGDSIPPRTIEPMVAAKTKNRAGKIRMF